MTSMSWGSLLAFSLFFPGLNGAAFCNDNFPIHCTPYRIVVTSISASSSLAEDVLVECNSHQECEVQNPNKECLEIIHYCRKKHDTLEIGDAPLRTESLFSMTSANYDKGKYQEAQNINCNIKHSGERKDIIRNLTVTMIDFSPFANTTDYCLYVKQHDMNPFCSGSRKVNAPYGPFRSITGWQFEIKLDAASTQVPAVRFWIQLDIHPNTDVSYHLECHSQPVILTTPTEIEEKTSPTPTQSPTPMQIKETSSATITISSVLGSLLLIAVLALFVGSALTCRKNEVKCTKSSRQSCNIPGDSPYTYIDINSIETLLNIPSDLPSKEDLAVLSKSCETLTGCKMQDRRLPSPPRDHEDLEDLTAQNHLIGAITQGANGSDVDDSSDSDTEYLPPREEHQTDTAMTSKFNEQDPCKDTNDNDACVNSNEAPCTKEQGTEVEGNQVLSENNDRPQDTEEPETTNAMTHNNDEDVEPDGAKLLENVYTHLSEDSLLTSDQRSKRTTYMRLDCKEENDKGKVDEEDGHGDEKTDESDGQADAQTDAKVDSEDTAEEIAINANEREEKIVPEKSQEEEEPEYLVLIPGDEDLENALVSSEGIVDSKGAKMQ